MRKQKKEQKTGDRYENKNQEPYLWLPVDAKEEKVLLHLYSAGKKIDEIAIPFYSCRWNPAANQ